MNAPPWPINPSVGQMFQNWAWSGSQWVATPTTGLRVLTQTFTASGSYMPSPGLVSLTVECIGAGGGSGGVVSPGAAFIIGAGGGGSGGRSIKTLPAALVRGGVPVTVGAGGAGSGALANEGGGDGSATLFGALCVANGGLGGSDNNGATGFGQGGGEAAPGVGDVTYPGAAGFTGLTFVLSSRLDQTGQGGMGGTMFGGTRALNVGVGAILQGLDAYPNTGAGASGACANQYGSGALGGGAGGSGICIVTEYCWGDRDDVNAWSPPVNVNLNVRNQPGWAPPPGPWPPGPWLPGPWPRTEDDP